MLKKYAQLLVNYCLDIQEGDRLFIQTTTLAEPLVREVYREALRAGAATVETDFIFRERQKIFKNRRHNPHGNRTVVFANGR